MTLETVKTNSVWLVYVHAISGQTDTMKSAQETSSRLETILIMINIFKVQLGEQFGTITVFFFFYKVHFTINVRLFSTQAISELLNASRDRCSTEGGHAFRKPLWRLKPTMWTTEPIWKDFCLWSRKHRRFFHKWHKNLRQTTQKYYITEERNLHDVCEKLNWKCIK